MNQPTTNPTYEEKLQKLRDAGVIRILEDNSYDTISPFIRYEDLTIWRCLYRIDKNLWTHNLYTHYKNDSMLEEIVSLWDKLDEPLSKQPNKQRIVNFMLNIL